MIPLLLVPWDDVNIHAPSKIALGQICLLRFCGVFTFNFGD